MGEEAYYHSDFGGVLVRTWTMSGEVHADLVIDSFICDVSVEPRSPDLVQRTHFTLAGSEAYDVAKALRRIADFIDSQRLES